MLKVDKTAAIKQYFSTPDNPVLTLPNTDTTLLMTVGFIGDMSGSDPQYILSNNVIGTNGINITQFASGDSAPANRNRIGVYVGSGTTVDILTDATVAAGEYWVFAIVRTVGSMTIKACKVLSTVPTDASAVTGGTIYATSATYDGSAGLFYGSRSDLAVDRLSNQAFGNSALVPRALTDLEIAKYASGMRIADLGYTSTFDISIVNGVVVDAGPNALQFTISGSPTVVAAPPYGFGAPALTAPVITGAPTITGSPAVGVTVGYTAAPVSGNPTPTPSQQWAVNGVDIVGATAATYTPTASDSGKTLTVRQIATNSQGTDSEPSAGVVIAAASSSTITVNAPANRRFYQRTGSVAPVDLSGTYTGTAPASIEYLRHDANGNPVGTWSAMTATIGGGTWSATPNMLIGGPNRIATRSLTLGGVVIATSNVHENVFFVGALHAWLGSSSAEKRFDSTSGTGFTPRGDVGMYGPATGWAAFDTAGCAIVEANSLAEQSSMPAAMLNLGKGGTTLADWLVTTRPEWTAFVAAVAAVGGKLETANITVGSNDAAEGIVVSREQHAANLRLLISRVRAVTNQPNLLIVLSGMNRRNNANVAQADMVRMAENDVGEDANVLHIQTLDFLLSGDNVHLSSSDAGFPASARRNGYVVGRKLYGDGVHARGPKITAFNYSGNTISATLQHRNGLDFAPAAVPTGFVVSDDSGAAVVQSVTRINATRLQITCDRPLTTNAKVTYLAGAAPAVNRQIFDTGATPLPMHVETALVATTAPGTGSFTSHQLISSGTPRIGQTCSYTWHAGGVIGVDVGVPTYGSATLSDQATLTVPGLPLGSGFMLMKFADGGVAYQPATVA